MSSERRLTRRFVSRTPSLPRMTTITDRIERELGIPGLAARLAEELEPTDLQSLLLDVYRRVVRRRPAAAFLADYTGNRFVRPSSIPPARYVEWERVALSVLPTGFEAIELSPVCPLGASAFMAGLEQDRVVTTIRNTEVVSDSTNILALEAAVRRRALKANDARSSQPVHLAASHRLLRGQRYPDPRWSQHFRVFSLCSGGRDRGGLRFELETLELQIGFYLSAIREFVGPAITLDVSLTALDSSPALTVALEQLCGRLHERFGADARIDASRSVGREYYVTACFWVHGIVESGDKAQLVDGGCVDWTRRLLNDAKERLVISGVGTDRVCTMC